MNAGILRTSLTSVRQAPEWLLVAVLVVNVLFSVVANLLVPRSFWLCLFGPTFGMVNLAYLSYTAVVIVGLILGIGGRRPSEVFLELHKLPAGLVYTAVVWSGLQLVMLAYYGSHGLSLSFAREWSQTGPVRLVGTFVGHFLGNALNEEVTFRGFLLIQFVLLCRQRWPSHSRIATVAGIALAAIVFALMHIPARLSQGSFTSARGVADDQLRLLAAAAVYSFVFLRTGNLFVAIGLHTICNLPTTVLAWHHLGPITSTVPLSFAVGVTAALCWPTAGVEDR